MAERQVLECDVCHRYPPQVKEITSYTITTGDGRSTKVDLCEQHDRAIRRLFDPAPGVTVQRVGARSYAVKEDDGDEGPEETPPPKRRRRT